MSFIACPTLGHVGTEWIMVTVSRRTLILRSTLSFLFQLVRDFNPGKQRSPQTLRTPVHSLWQMNGQNQATMPVQRQDLFSLPGLSKPHTLALQAPRKQTS